MSRDPLRERDLRNSESILDRIIENDAREAAAADREGDGIELAPVVPLHRRRWPYAVAAAALAAVIAGTSWIAGDRSSLTAEPLTDPTPTVTVSETPGPTPDPGLSTTPSATPTPTATRTPSPTPTGRATMSPSPTASRTPTPGATQSSTATPSPDSIDPPAVTYVAGGFMVDGTWQISFRVCPGTAPEQLSNSDVTIRLEGSGSVHRAGSGLAVGRPEPNQLGRFTSCQETAVVFTGMPTTEERAIVTVQLSDGPHYFGVGRW